MGKVLTSGAKASCDAFPVFEESASYCSMYKRIVAPTEPVPDKRNTCNPSHFLVRDIEVFSEMLMLLTA
jgi:hypothetical protein